MTNEEFSNEFDTLLSPLTSAVFDEYQKSVFLTKAQEQIVISLYSGALTGKSFEETEQLRKYISPLVKTYVTDEITQGNITDNSYIVNLESDTMFITFESVIINTENCGNITAEVVPTTQDDLHRTLRNPFKKQNSRRVLRLDNTSSQVELISDYPVIKYKNRYISQPNPIILVDLPDGLTINKKPNKLQCELNPALHRVILETAVSMAAKSVTPKQESRT